MLKGVMHMHSTHSYDGKVSLKDLKELLVAEGISFCCMSEHTDELDMERAEVFIRECDVLSDSNFLFIPGFEVPYKNTHVLMFGCREFMKSFAEDARELRAWAYLASFVSLAHPVRNHYEVDDDLLSVLDGIEIWNQQYDGKAVPRTRAVKLLKDLREQKPELRATGGLDFHRREHFGAPTVLIDIEILSEDVILEKLRSGAYAFGHTTFRVSGTGTLEGALSLSNSIRSYMHTGIITAGKRVNALLAACGLSFPKSLKRAIRARM